MDTQNEISPAAGGSPGNAPLTPRKATQDPRSFSWDVNKQGEPKQVFKTHPAGRRAFRLKVASRLRTPTKQREFMKEVALAVIAENPVQVKEVREDASKINYLVARGVQKTGGVAGRLIERYLRAALGLPDLATDTPLDVAA